MANVHRILTSLRRTAVLAAALALSWVGVGITAPVHAAPDGYLWWPASGVAYGNAPYWGGSPAGFSRAIVAMSPTRDGQGYVMVSKAGQIYAYGNAQYLGGSPGGVTGEISDVSYRTDGAHGYVMVSTTGGHYAYSTPWLGNPTGTTAIF